MPFGPLSPDQFAEQINMHGGGSQNLRTGMALVPGADHGYAVGVPGHEETLGRPTTADDVRGYQARLRANPAIASNPRAMHGAWQPDTEPGTTHDHSELIDDRREAVVLGRGRKEKAIFGVHEFADISLSAAKPARRTYYDKASKSFQGVSHIGTGQLGWQEVTYPVRGAGRGRKYVKR